MFSRKPLLLAGGALWVLHLLLTFTLGKSGPGPLFSLLIQFALVIMTVVASLGAAARSQKLGCYFWRFFAVSYAILSVGLGLSVFNLYHDNQLIEVIVNAIFSFWFVPMGGALFLDADVEPKGFDWLLILDSLQIGLFFVAAYYYFFYLPERAGNAGTELEHSVWAPYFFYYGILTAAFFVRASFTQSTVMRSLFGRVGLLLFLSGCADAFYYYGPGQSLETGEWVDLMWSALDLAPLALAVTWSKPERAQTLSRPLEGGNLVITQLLPLFYPLLVLGMSARLAQAKLGVAWGVIFASFACSSARLLVTHYRQRLGTEQLHQSHDLLRAVIEGTTDAVFVKDLRGKYLMINSAGADLLGRPAAEIVGKTDADLLGKEAAEALTRKERLLLQSETMRTDEEVITINGGKRTYLTTKGPFRNELGKTSGLIGIGCDITERKKIEDQLRQSQKMDAIGKLAGGIAHDFNNLLTVIKGYCRLLSEDTTNVGALERIEEAADRATSLTRQMLAFSRRQVLQPQVLDLNAVIQNLEKMLAPLIGEHIRITIERGADLGSVRVDASQIEQVIVNLAINARDAMPNGGKLLLQTENVELSTKKQDDDVEIPTGRYVLLKVNDNGIGMDDTVKTRIFEPFFTTKEQGKGTGLGLSTVYGIVKQSDGFIAVNSTPGKGTSFSIYLPRVEAETSSQNTSPGRSQTPKGTETVLLVEDDDDLRELARKVLSRCGYRVLVSPANEAEQLCQQHRGSIQLLVTDILMPEVNGVELARRVTQHCPTMRVLFISGYSDDSIVPRGVIEPGTHFLAKPFTPSALATKVRDILDSPLAA